MKTTTVYVYLTPEQVKRLKALMEERHTSIGHVVQEIVEKALEEAK